MGIAGREAIKGPVWERRDRAESRALIDSILQSQEIGFCLHFPMSTKNMVIQSTLKK